MYPTTQKFHFSEYKLEKFLHMHKHVNGNVAWKGNIEKYEYF